MTNYYVQRRNGAIVGAFLNPQPGIPEELLPDTAPELVAFFAGPTQAERLAINRASAAALVADGAPDRILIRGALKLIHGAFAEQAAWNAKVRQRLTVAGLGDPGAPPVVRDWAALMAALTQLIAGGAGDPPAQPAPVPPP